MGLDKDFNTYNINADDAACAIARAVHAEKLAFLTDIEGVRRDPEDPTTLISELHVKEARAAYRQTAISEAACSRSSRTASTPLKNGVSRVHILDGRMAHCLLLEIFTNKGIGTAILGEGEEQYYEGK